MYVKNCQYRYKKENSMLIGTRGHDIDAAGAAKLAEKMQKEGLEAIQLVAYRSIPGIGEAPGSLSPALAWSISREFEKRDIHIALLGSYFNLLEKDPEKLKSSIDRFKEYLRYAADFRCRVVGTETGSYNADMSFHPENHGGKAMETVIAIFRELVKEAEQHGAIVAVEGLYNFVISTPERVQRLLEEIDSSNLQVILDPVNLLHIGNYDRVKEIIEESFERYGERIILLHAKDFIIEDNKIKTVPLGQGLMDFSHLMRIAGQYKPGIPIIIEDLQGDDLAVSHTHLQQVRNSLQMG
jgi:L-ribulose-5-phosphate 3-epimerase